MLLGDIRNIFATESDGETKDQLERLEELLLRADLGSKTTNAILDDLRLFSRFELSYFIVIIITNIITII